MNTPKDASDEQIAKLMGDEMTRVTYFADVLNRIDSLFKPNVTVRHRDLKETQRIVVPYSTPVVDLARAFASIASCMHHSES